LTAAPLANRYAAWFDSHPRDALPSLESSDVREVRWRTGVGHLRGAPLRVADRPRRLTEFDI
jgi:hypothetical protein